MNREATLRVLHVDDDPTATRLVAAKLRERGIEVTELHDPSQAVDMVLNDNYRIVVLDIDMPVLNGIELLERIKRIDGGTAVIMLTGLVSLSSALRAMRKGAHACLFKPLVDVDALVDCIHEVDRNNRRWWESLKQLSELRRQEQAIHDDDITPCHFSLER